MKNTYIIYSSHLSNDSESNVIEASRRLATHLRGLFPNVVVRVKHGIEGVGSGWQGEDEQGVGEDMDAAAERFDCWGLTPPKNAYATTYHRDGSVTVWDIYSQGWTRTRELDDNVSASLDATERAKIQRHLARHQKA